MKKNNPYKKIFLIAIAALLMIPLPFYMHQTAGTGKATAISWTIFTICFWVGLLIFWMARRKK
jgi:hypothetical protein